MSEPPRLQKRKKRTRIHEVPTTAMSKILSRIPIIRRDVFKLLLIVFLSVFLLATLFFQNVVITVVQTSGLT
jgi:hypothetical protein